jgi:predicted transposase/invertase (TIGR01784 family)
MLQLQLSLKWVPEFEIVERIRKEEKKIREEAVKEAKNDEKISMARNSLKEGLSVELIMKLTGLTKEEIKKL